MTTTTKHTFLYEDVWPIRDGKVEIIFGSANVHCKTRNDGETPDERYARLDQYDEFVDWLNGGALAVAHRKAQHFDVDSPGVLDTLFRDAQGAIYGHVIARQPGKPDAIRVLGTNA